MVGSTSNIYVSITGPRENEQPDTYRRAHHDWLISIEPHHRHHTFGTGNKDPEPLHYTATWDSEKEVYTVDSHEISKDPGIIGNILIVEEAHISTDKLHDMLKEDVGAQTPSKTTKDKASSDDEPEHWIRGAIQGLQHRKVAQTFDIDEFIMFAHGYIANRMDNEAPALMAYPKIHKEAEKKSSKHKFWVSTPPPHRTKINSEGEARKYGGLM